MRSLPLALLAAALLALGGCAGSKPYTTGPIKTFDPDNRDVPPPREVPGNQYWDPIDRTFFYQVEKPLNFNWTFRGLAEGLGLAGPREADNVNTLDEVPNSSWFTQRHFYFPMSLEALRRGPNTGDGPDTAGVWTVTAGKNEGKTKGFTIKDARGDRYVVKFDGPDYPELTSSAEIISTKIYHAAGYFVPENYITHFRPERVVVGEGAEVEVGGRERAMTAKDLTAILDPLPRRPDGTVRAMASKFVDGRPVGVWSFRGTRRDDPNDRVRHEHRRELRGLSVLGAWLNDADRRDANTMAVYTDNGDGDSLGFIRHFVLDMGSTLGANASGIHTPRHGYEYMFDPRTIAARLFTLGVYETPWEFIPPGTSFYPAVGYFEADLFEPGGWVMAHPNPAYERRTLRDAFWGAKRVMAFSEAEVRALVAEGQITDPEAEEYLVQTLLKRQEKIGRYWFARINPLDRFAVAAGGGEALAERGSNGAATEGPEPALVLTFDDLAVTGGLEAAAASRYRWAVYHGRARLAHGEAEAPEVPLPPLPAAARASADEDDRVLRVELRTLRAGREPSKRTSVYVHLPNGGAPRVVGVERET